MRPYVKPDVPSPPYIAGQHVRVDGVLFEITSATPVQTPYRKAGQDTRVTGWTLGLRRLDEKKSNACTALLLATTAALL